MNCLKCAIILFMIVLVGCAYNVRIDSNIDPTATIGNLVNLKVGLFTPEETKRFRISDKIKLNTYTFQVGEALESIITKSTGRVFVHTETLESYPTEQMISEKNLDLVVIPKVTAGNVSLNEKEGFLLNSAEGNTTLTVQLVFYDPELIQLTTIVTSGVGLGSEAIMFSAAEKQYAASVESALRNLADDMVHKINGNYDIRKKAEDMKQ